MRKIFAVTLCVAILMTNFTIVNGENNENEIDRIITDIIDKAKVPGIAISVTNESEILFEKGYGVESLKTKKPMTKNSLSSIGSVTKSFTTLAILQQVEKGKINLDDTVVKYIPEFKTLDEGKSKQITIRMLLNNTSGLPHNASFDIFSRKTEDVNFMEVIKKNQTIELLFDPGTAYNYSNEGFVIAGRILEIATGMPYSKYMEQYVFKPLKMNRTTTDIEKIKNIEVLYGHQGGINTYIPSAQSYMGLMIPAGSETRSSVHELAYYLQMLMNQGRYQDQQLIGEELFQQTLGKPVIPFSMYGHDLKYGYGWIHMKGTDIQLHGGQTMSMSAMLMWDKEKKIGVSILYNVASVNPESNSDILNVAEDVLSVYTGKTYPHKEEQYLKRGQLKELDSQFYGEYISEDGYTRMMIEKGETPIAHMKGVQGISEYKLSQMSSTQLLAENIAFETLMLVERGGDNSIISISHPLIGKFLPDTPLILDGYSSLNWNGVSFIYPQDFEINTTSKECQLNSTQGFLDIVELNSSESFFPNESGLIKETDVREVFMNSKRVSEKINIVDKNGTLFAHLYVRIEGMKVIGITGEIPFDQLTKVRARVIKPLITSLKFK